MNIVFEIDLVSIFDEYLIFLQIEFVGNVSSKILCIVDNFPVLV